MVADDVINYNNHIACDSNSRSEVVIPILIKDQLFGVLDVDSDKKSSFDSIDAKYLAQIIELVYIN
jgi:GAF domain-containing protein